MAVHAAAVNGVGMRAWPNTFTVPGVGVGRRERHPQLGRRDYPARGVGRRDYPARGVGRKERNPNLRGVGSFDWGGFWGSQAGDLSSIFKEWLLRRTGGDREPQPPVVVVRQEPAEPRRDTSRAAGFGWAKWAIPVGLVGILLMALLWASRRKGR